MVSPLIWMIVYLVYMGSMIALGIAAGNSGSWQRVSDGKILVFRSPWTHTAFGVMCAAFMVLTLPLVGAVTLNSPHLLLGLMLFALSVGGGLLIFWMCSPMELWIDRQEKIYRYSRLWLPPSRNSLSRPLTDFTGVCALSGGTLLLVFRKRSGLLYGCTLGRFANKSLAEEQARKFSEDTGLPLVDVPWRRHNQGFVG